MRDDTVATIEKTIGRNLVRLTIFQDDQPESPREWDNLGTMTCFHRKYDLGDKHDLKSHDVDGWDGLERYLKEQKDAVIILPLFLYDHSGITMSTSAKYPYNDRWDANQVGFIWVSRERLLKEYGGKKVTKKTLATATKVLLSEVEVYDQYIGGQVYGFQLHKVIACSHCKKQDTEEIDSCWGFFGTNFETNGMADTVEEKYRILFDEISL